MDISKRLANKIANELNLDKEKYEVINYGVFAFFQIMMSILLVAILGWILGILLQVLIVSFTSSILRQYSGGVHASNPTICLIIGTIVTISIAYIAKLIIMNTNDSIILLIGLIISAISYYIIYTKAPVDSKAKPINNIDKRNRMRRNSLVLLSIYLLILIMLLIGYYKTNNKILIEFTVCIYLAYGWQVFSLTIIGHKIINKFDSIIKKIFFKKRGNYNEKT
jgi:accessory gene regulator B